MTLRAGWNSTIFGPYFVIGALYSGSAGVILTMSAFRKVYHLEEYITPRHFDLMSKIVLSLTMIYAYFNLNEYWVPAYKMESHEGGLLTALFTGGYSTVFWILQFGTVLLPIIILATPRGRKPVGATLACIIIVAGAWVKRYIIVIPTLLHPFLPIQNVPESWSTYFPNWVEFSVTGGALAGIFLVITLFSKFFPIGSIWEIEEGVHLAALTGAPVVPNSQGHTNHVTIPPVKEAFAK
jgi:Ni/Fe-hydrogenase subunit HybB-like protein